jgi:hypothetical protein
MHVSSNATDAPSTVNASFPNALRFSPVAVTITSASSSVAGPRRIPVRVKRLDPVGDDRRVTRRIA